MNHPQTRVILSGVPSRADAEKETGGTERRRRSRRFGATSPADFPDVLTTDGADQTDGSLGKWRLPQGSSVSSAPSVVHPFAATKVFNSLLNIEES